MYKKVVSYWYSIRWNPAFEEFKDFNIERATEQKPPQRVNQRTEEKL